MQDTKQRFDLSALEDDYEITGELSADGDGRAFIATRKDAAAKRRDDRTGVVIEVVGPPPGDEGHALTHLAADTQVLTRIGHRRLIPVVDARWVGADAFAVITQRITDPSLAQVLATGQQFTNPRIAAILREVNGLLEWAREQKIVHRAITPDRIHLEPKTDRVRVSFALAPIHRIEPSEPADVDARTIARLAMVMLTGIVDPEGYEGKSFGELRPDLPQQVIQATSDLLAPKTRGADVAAYLALVGMADPLAAGETEVERIRDEILEEQLTEREKLAAERTAFERTMEDERQKLAKEQEELKRATAAERATFERTLAEERDKLAKERAELERTMEQERDKAAKEREELQRALAAERGTLERTLDEERDRLAKERAGLQQAMEQERATLARTIEQEREKLEKEREGLQRAMELERDKLEKERVALQRTIELDREKLAKERAGLQRTMDQEGAAFHRTMDQEREKLEKERAALQRTMEREREKLAKERAELQRSAAAERASLVAMRAELERAGAEQRAQLERAAAEDRQRIAALRAEIQRAGELEIEKKRQTALDELTDTDSALDRGEFAVPLFVPPVIAPLEQLRFDGDSPLMREQDLVEEDVADEDVADEDVVEEDVAAKDVAAVEDDTEEEFVVAPIHADARPRELSAVTRTSKTATDDASRRRTNWIVSGGLAGLVTLTIASAVMLGGRSTRVQASAPAATSSTAPTAPVAAAAPTPAVPLPASVKLDSSAGTVV